MPRLQETEILRELFIKSVRGEPGTCLTKGIVSETIRWALGCSGISELCLNVFLWQSKQGMEPFTL